MAKTPATAGFTLTELVVALAIAAIATSLAVSSYRSYLLRGYRIEALQSLLAAAAEQEKFHLGHGHYSDRLDAGAGSQPPGLPIASQTLRNRYRLAIESADAASYRLVASPAVGHEDRLCAHMAIDQSGRRQALDQEGRDSTAKCW